MQTSVNIGNLGWLQSNSGKIDVVYSYSETGTQITGVQA